MKAAIDKRKVMRNAWYLKRAVMKVHCFGECLRKAWSNERLRRMQHLAEGTPLAEPVPASCRSVGSSAQNNPAFTAGCVAYYAQARAGQYFGD